MDPLVVCIGAVTVDLIVVAEPVPDDGRIVARDAMLSSGGPAATAAVTLARLGVPVAFVGTVGDDPGGRVAAEALEREGVNLTGLDVRRGVATPVSAIRVDPRSGQRAIATFYGTQAVPGLASRSLRHVRSAAWTHVDQLGWGTVPAVRSAHAPCRISVDAGNPIPDLSLDGIALYAPTEEQLLQRYPAGSVLDGMRAAIGEGAETVVVTRGSNGSAAATAADGGGEIVEAAAVAVRVVSTLGAGDVFHGAFLAARVRDWAVPDALRLANAAAALSCRGLDGRSAIPTWDQAVALAGVPGTGA